MFSPIGYSQLAVRLAFILDFALQTSIDYYKYNR